MINFVVINNKKVTYKLTYKSLAELKTHSEQTRNRASLQSVAQTNSIAGALIPELLGNSFDLSSGAPIIDANNNIISGHGRIEALKKCYYNNDLYANFVEYVEFCNTLLARDFDVDFLDDKILVRVIDNQYSTIDTIHNANNTTLAYTPHELAKINCKRDLSTLNNFVASFAQNEAAKYYNNGMLNNLVIDDYNNAKIIKALPDVKLFENFINLPTLDNKNIIHAIINNLDDVLDLQKNNIKLYDLFLLAIDKYIQLKNNNILITDFIAQIDIFNDDYNNDDFINFLNIFNNNNNAVKKLTSELSMYFYNKKTIDLFANTDNFEHINQPTEDTKNMQNNTPTPLNDLDTIKPIELPIPRDWQQNILNKLDNTTDNRILINAPTGAGKAFLMMFIILQAIQSGKRCLLLVDRQQLITQLCESAKLFGFDFNLLHGRIKEWEQSKLLTIGMIQTFAKINIPHPFNFDLLLVDECHTLYKPLIDFINLFTGRVIGVTATPYTNGIMDVYKNIIEATTVAKLVDNNTLVPIEVYELTPIDMSNTQLVANEFKPSMIKKRSAKIYGDVKQVYNTHVKMLQCNTLIFGANIEHCQDIKSELDSVDVVSAIYTSHQSSKERTEILQQFDNDSSMVLITVGALAKGFDRNKIDVILDLRPLNSSLSEYIQMLGRGMRVRENKTHCKVFDFSGNWARFGAKILDINANGSSGVIQEYNYIYQAKKDAKKFTKEDIDFMEEVKQRTRNTELTIRYDDLQLLKVMDAQQWRRGIQAMQYALANGYEYVPLYYAFETVYDIGKVLKHKKPEELKDCFFKNGILVRAGFSGVLDFHYQGKI